MCNPTPFIDLLSLKTQSMDTLRNVMPFMTVNAIIRINDKLISDNIFVTSASVTPQKNQLTRYSISQITYRMN